MYVVALNVACHFTVLMQSFCKTLVLNDDYLTEPDQSTVGLNLKLQENFFYETTVNPL